MPGKSDIRAGGAFVELFVKGAKLEQGLKKGSALLADFGKNAKALGVKIAAVGSAAVAGFAVAVKQFADSGDELVKMSERTGMGIKALSALRYAADQSGASLDDVEKASKKLASVLTDAANGSKTAAETLQHLGLSLSDLEGLSPDELFMKTSRALASVEDATTRAALAQDIFGKSGTRLLPLLAEGEKGLEAMRKEAERLGVTMDEKTARSGTAVGDAFDRIKAALSGTANAIGSALAPKLTELADRVAFAIGTINAWISQHKELVIVAAKAAVAITLVGTAIAAAGAAAVIAGNAIASMVIIIGGVIGVLTALNPVILLVSAAIAALVLDLAIVATAMAATAGAFLYASGIVPQLVSALAPLLDAVKAIASALMSGDFQKAWDIAATAIKYFGSVALDVFQQIPEFAGYAAGKITKALIDGFTKAWEWILSQMKSVLTGMLSAASNFAPQLLAAMFSGNFTAAAANIAFAMKDVLKDVSKSASKIGAEFGGAFQAGFDGSEGPKLDASKRTADLRDALKTMTFPSSSAGKMAAEAFAQMSSVGMFAGGGGGVPTLDSEGFAKGGKKPDIDPSAIDKYQARLSELSQALSKGRITQTEYDSGIQQLRRDMLDITNPIQQYRDRVALLQKALQDSSISQEEFSREVQKAKEPFVDVSAINQYRERLAELGQALSSGVITHLEYESGMGELRRQMLDLHDPIQEYRNRVALLQQALSDGTISQSEFQQELKAAQSGFVEQTPIERYMERLRELKALFDAGIIDRKQFETAQMDALPDKVKAIIDRSKTPLQKFNEQITEARDYFSKGLINKEQFAAEQERLQKEFREAETKGRPKGEVAVSFSAASLIAQGMGSQGGGRDVLGTKMEQQIKATDSQTEVLKRIEENTKKKNVFT